MTTHATSLADHYHTHEGYRRFTQEHRDGGANGIHFILADQHAHNFTDPATEELVLNLSLKSDMSFRWNIGDGWTAEHRVRSGSLTVCPIATQIEYDCGGDHRILMVACPKRYLQSLLDEYGFRSFDVLSPLNSQTIVNDGYIARVLRDMWHFSVRQDSAAPMMIDGMWQAVVSQLLHRVHITTQRKTTALGAQEIDKLDAFLFDRLDTSLGVDDLAAVLAMQPVPFSRSLKQRTGQTPYQYVLSRRIARAQELLAEGDLPLAEIAYACGFASQSHMTDVFRQKLGVTPGRYRTEVCA